MEPLKKKRKIVHIDNLTGTEDITFMPGIKYSVMVHPSAAEAAKYESVSPPYSDYKPSGAHGGFGKYRLGSCVFSPTTC